MSASERWVVFTRRGGGGDMSAGGEGMSTGHAYLS